MPKDKPISRGNAVAEATKPVVRTKHEIRIIGGAWKRSKLLVADRPGLRPTPDRVRETLFNWLGQDLTGWHCIDAFSGTGVLGFEAASRGAAEVWLVEQDPAQRIQVDGLAAQVHIGGWSARPGRFAFHAGIVAAAAHCERPERAPRSGAGWAVAPSMMAFHS